MIDTMVGNVCDRYETPANDTVTNQTTAASVMTENHDSEDVHTVVI